MTNKWQGELGSSVDNPVFRKNAFDAWLAWEFLQRGVAGESREMKPKELSELCGKDKSNIKKLHRNALRNASYPQQV